MRNQICCPKCGNKDIEITTETQTTGKDYSAGKGCLGYLILGPLGLLCGACGKNKTTTTTTGNFFFCSKCGEKFINPDYLKTRIDYTESQARICLPLCVIFGIFFGLFYLFCLGEISFKYGLLLLIFCLVAFTGGGYFAKKCNESYAKKLKKQLDELEKNMSQFDEN